MEGKTWTQYNEGIKVGGIKKSEPKRVDLYESCDSFFLYYKVLMVVLF